METVNLTSGFVLLGFSDFHYNHAVIFSAILVIYVLTWTANFLLLSSIKLSPQLHTPMYFFLGNLSVVDVSFSTVTVPKLLSCILHGVASISFLGCFLQMFFFLFLGTTESYLLAVMALDRYLAICNPLRYSLLMSDKARVMLTSSCWLAASLHSLLHTYILSHLKYCEDRLIPHFFCDVTPLVKLSCSSTTLAELLIYTEGSLAGNIPFLFILISYVLITRAILKMETRRSRSKAFSSCSSHLMVICLFYGTDIFIYFRPPSDYSSQYDRLVSMAYTIITPMLNPFIYSLRNQDVKKALKKQIIKSQLTSEDLFPIFSNVTFTSVTEFIIFGFPSLQKYQLLLFFVFLSIYLFALSGNGLIFALVLLDQHLHTPMYFFVGNLSFLDMSYTSVTIPRMLAKFVLNLDTISYTACFAQMYLFLSLTATECLLLTVMAYDRYLAICSPLHYPTIMTRRMNALLSAVAWSGGFATPITVVLLALKLPFCGPNIIHHYYCDHPPLLQLACADTSFNVTVGSSIGAFIILISFALVVISYIKIILAIIKISSHDGRKKTFSTCASHFAVVSLFFLPLIFMYVRPTASYSSDVDSLVAMLYTVLTPMMNPIIYSLRNKDIKRALQRNISYKCAVTIIE
ncbi:olfactory receptor 11H6-like [Mantella aurantiaca]